MSAQPNLSFVLLLFKSLLDTCGSYDAHSWSGLCSSSSPPNLELFFLHFWCVYQPFLECPFKIAKRVKLFLKLVSDKCWSSLRSDQSEVFWNPLDIWSARISLDFNPRPSFLVLRIVGIKCFWRQPSISSQCSCEHVRLRFCQQKPSVAYLSIRVGPSGFLVFCPHF